jgi:hypothetical protein
VYDVYEAGSAIRCYKSWAVLSWKRAVDVYYQNNEARSDVILRFVLCKSRRFATLPLARDIMSTVQRRSYALPFCNRFHTPKRHEFIIL